MAKNHLSLRLVSKRKKQADAKQIHQYIIIKWSYTFMIYIICIGLFMFINAFKNQLGIHFFEFIPFGGPLIYMRSILFISIIIGIFRNPEILYGMPNFNRNSIETSNGNKTILNKTTFIPELHYLPNTTLTENQLNSYVSVVKEFMEGNAKPFINYDFNIRTLAQGTGIPQHHLAFMFRYHGEETFVDFRNRYRLNEAIRKLNNQEHKAKTLEGIGKESGFASRITFFNVFKKNTGMNPSEYIEKVLDKDKNI